MPYLSEEQESVTSLMYSEIFICFQVNEVEAMYLIVAEYHCNFTLNSGTTAGIRPRGRSAST
jgi:hypothetical protein